jgi:hypothetical protein
LPEIEFEGIPSGDCECFCWEVTEEQYKDIVGEESYKMEKEFRAESWHEKRMKEIGHPPSPWRIYDIELLDKMGLMDSKNKMKVKITIEEIEQCPEK